MLADEYIEITQKISGVPFSITNGLIPFGILVAAVSGFYFYMKRRYGATNTEAIQMVFVLLLVAFIILTVTGIFFRGTGMKLVWPRNIGPQP